MSMKEREKELGKKEKREKRERERKYIWNGRSLGSTDGGEGARARLILALCEYIWNAPAVSLVFPTFDDTGSLGSPPRQVVFPLGSMAPPWVAKTHHFLFNPTFP